jgi:drug/metabolite transporter (DMT)-like permease
MAVPFAQRGRRNSHDDGGLLSAPWTAATPSAATAQAAAPSPAGVRVAPTRRETVMGMTLVLASTLCFSVMALCVSLLHGAIPSFQTASIRFAVQALCTVASALWVYRARLGDRRPWLGLPKNRRMLVQRALWGAGGMTSYFYALSTIRLSDASALVFSNVPLTAVLAHFILGEEYTAVDAATSVLCMGGVVLVAQPAALFGEPPAPSEDPAGAGATAIPWFAVVVCMFGAVCSAMAYVSIRTLGKSEDTWTVVLYFALIGAVITPVLTAIFQTFVAVSSAREALLLVTTGVTAALGQYLMTRGMQLSAVGPATVMRYGDIVFALVFQATLLSDPPGPLKLTGCALIMTCMAGELHRQRRKGRAAGAGSAAGAVSPGAHGPAGHSLPPTGSITRLAVKLGLGKLIALGAQGHHAGEASAGQATAAAAATLQPPLDSAAGLHSEQEIRRLEQLLAPAVRLLGTNSTRESGDTALGDDSRPGSAAPAAVACVGEKQATVAADH